MTSLLLYPFRYLILQLPLYLKLNCKKRVVTQTVSYEPNPILITPIYSWPSLNFDLFFSAYFVAIYPFGKQVKDIKWPLWWISVIHVFDRNFVTSHINIIIDVIALSLSPTIFKILFPIICLIWESILFFDQILNEFSL